MTLPCCQLSDWYLQRSTQGSRNENVNEFKMVNTWEYILYSRQVKLRWLEPCNDHDSRVCQTNQ
ncbi:CLUMA_CG001565, isoform A [Clunio marinus]|uniref:CLUMA_CG001565, isoform A n=1 Tax=Clunio marinus TaxID=568069 RepID=A0A1J1HMU0_9DIPT|nr:CLUMA_CG001565, isoform A [Clunio marinus]